ncbi:MAG: single-stranded DNA-binding protein [Candidatus Dormibacteraceae bacterium]
MSLNKVMLIGRLTRDPEMRYTPSGQPVTSFGLATNRYFSGAEGERKEMTDFHDIVCWNIGKRKLAEIVAQYTRKGSQIYVEGRLQTRSWDGQDGQKRYRTEVVANDVQFLDSRNAQSGFDAEGENGASSAAASVPLPVAAGEPPIRDVDPDEIPF